MPAEPRGGELRRLAAMLLVAICIVAVVSAVMLDRRLNQATRAEQDKTEKLYESLVSQARANRWSGRMGRRFASLTILKEAAKIARERNMPAERFHELRNEAIACFALADVEVVKEWPGCPSGSMSVDFTRALDRYARGDNQGNVSIRRVSDDAEVQRLPGSGIPASRGPWFSPDGRFLAVGYSREGFQSNRRQKVWKLDGPQPVVVVDFGEGPFDFSSDSTRIAVGHHNGPLCVYDTTSGKEIQRLTLGFSPVWCAYHPSQNVLAISGSKVQVWNLDARKMTAEFTSPCHGLAWHPDGKRLAAGGYGKLHLWDVTTGKPVIAFQEAPIGEQPNVGFLNDGSLLVSNDYNHVLRVWSIRTGRQIFNTPLWAYPGHFSNDSRLLVGATADKLQLLRVAGGGEFRTVNSNDRGITGFGRAASLCFSATCEKSELSEESRRGGRDNSLSSLFSQFTDDQA